ncbi:hypothetical protein FFLO_07226 [Filobasidium floriforme]|uniref:Uncharacterized protein n=1 Tax=Filobasidium floriforme TaxID=5210 RepID=A0A8K0JJ28_9TREE|nr:hypothetical protein FFLO_07226 [Filobasidium floriforme]
MLYGPLSGFGTWAFERNNGALAKVPHNQKPRDVPSTLLRFWWRELRLASLLANPAPDASDREKRAIEDLLRDVRAIAGSVMLEEARRALGSRMRLPPPFQRNRVVDLGQHAAYRPLLAYLSRRFPEVGFVDETQYLDGRPCLARRSNGYKLFTHVIYQGYKFCSKLYSRTRRDQYALAAIDDDGIRHLVRIKLFLTADLYTGDDQPRIPVKLALVETFVPVSSDLMPWGVRSIDTGTRIYRDEQKDVRFIELERLHASTIVSSINTNGHGTCLASISCDKEGEEPEFWLAADDDEQVDWPDQEE